MRKRAEVTLRFDRTKMPKDHLDILHTIRDLFDKLGVSFDSGGNVCSIDWEWDWSLKGPVEVLHTRFKEN